MKIAPNVSIRIAGSEAVSLELDVDRQLGSVRLRPKHGGNSVLTLDGNAFDFPLFAAPNSVIVEWRASGSEEAAYTNTVEYVSRHYFGLDELRGYGGGRDDFGSLPDETLWAARQAATDVFEEASHRSFVTRFGRTKDYGRDGELVAAHRDVQEVATSGYVQISDSRFKRSPGCGPFPKWVEYSYGAESMPAEVSRAVLELAAYILRPANRPIGATGESTDAGYIHFTTAGRDGATAIPEVNAAIEMFGAGRRLLW